mmetsp:Transcript_1028/g.2999  ORF Transcript_1028/g.2999 Transcript_1028/m.2999 type:complete len:151 (+) Transcript_1028:110-562(+)
MPFTTQRMGNMSRHNTNLLESILQQTQSGLPDATDHLERLLAEQRAGESQQSSKSPLMLGPFDLPSYGQATPMSIADQAYLIAQNRVLIQHVTRMQDHLMEMNVAQSGLEPTEVAKQEQNKKTKKKEARKGSKKSKEGGKHDRESPTTPS